MTYYEWLFETGYPLMLAGLIFLGILAGMLLNYLEDREDDEDDYPEDDTSESGWVR
jgi:4-hydroxybenzoate polyprenyltransferase